MRSSIQLHFLLLVFISIVMPNFCLAQKNVSMEDFLLEMQEVYDITIACNKDLIEGRDLPDDFKPTGEVEKIVSNALKVHGLELKKIDDRNFYVKKGRRYKPILTKSEIIIQGKVIGNIKDETGAPLQGVHVFIESLMVGTFTDAQGNYVLENIPLGNYEAEVSYIGYINKKASFKITRLQKNYNFSYNLQPDLLALQTVIVTGVTHPTINLESGVAATTISEDAIQELAPRSLADILQKIPGYYLETSSGEVSNSLFSRGMPSEGSYQYVVLQEDGLPVYEGGNLDWTPADLFHRVDGTVKLVEGVRSGSSGIFASNAPGGIINFMSKTGGSKTKGGIKLQTSDYGQIRTEGEIGGPIKKGLLHYHIGGYFRIDNGIRNPGFRANKGGQVKGNITRIFSSGYVRVSAKYLNDRNIFYSSIPLQHTERPKSIPLFNANYGTMTSVNIQNIELPTPDSSESFDLADGIHTHLGYLGTHAKFDIGDGWTIDNKNRISLINNNSNAILSVLSAIEASEFARTRKLVQETATFLYTYADNGDPFNAFSGNGLVLEAGWLANQQTMYNLINSFEISKKTEKYQASGSIYLSGFTNETRRRWANILLEANGNQARPLNLNFYDSDGDLIQQATHNGFTNFQLSDSYLGANGSAFVAATYFHGRYNLSEGTYFDAGGRLENLRANGSVDDTRIINLDPENQTNNVLSNVLYSDSTATPYQVNKIAYAWTFGFNHMFNEQSSFFVRFSDGFRMPDFDNWHQNQELDGGQVERIFQSEGGYKLSSKKYAVLFSGFYSYIANQVTTLAIYNEDEIILPSQTRNAQTFGGELEGIIQFTKRFSFDFTATYQRAIYLVDPSQEVNPDFRVNGNEVKRIPNLYFIVKPSYEYKGFKVYGTAQYIGERFSDEINTDILPAFMSFNVGASYKYKSYSLLVQAQNLTNEVGLTDGNPRILADNSGEATRMARPILGRSIIAFVAYQF